MCFQKEPTVLKHTVRSLGTLLLRQTRIPPPPLANAAPVAFYQERFWFPHIFFMCCLKMSFELVGFHALGRQDITTQQTFRLLLVVFSYASKSILKEGFIIFSLSFWCLFLSFTWRCWRLAWVKKSFHFLNCISLALIFLLASLLCARFMFDVMFMFMLICVVVWIKICRVPAFYLNSIFMRGCFELCVVFLFFIIKNIIYMFLYWSLTISGDPISIPCDPTRGRDPKVGNHCPRRLFLTCWFHGNINININWFNSNLSVNKYQMLTVSVVLKSSVMCDLSYDVDVFQRVEGNLITFVLKLWNGLCNFFD